MQLLRKYSIRFFIALTGIIMGFTAARAGNGGGGQVKALALLDGSRHQIAKDSSITVEDSAFYNPSYAGQLDKSYTVQNAVTVMINEASTRYMHSKFNVTIKLHISWLDSLGNTDTVNKSFTVGYDSAKTYNSRSSFVFQGAHKVTVKVISDSTDATGWDPTAVLLIENQLTAQPAFHLNCNTTVSNIAINAVPDTADELPVSWNAIFGAEQYDLEWTYVDKTALDAGRYGSSPYSPALIFRNSATRVTTTGTSYNIPIIYDDSGTLFIRVRPTQLGKTGSVTAAIWSSDASTAVMGAFTFTGHERPLNWQSNISYAEEGKRKVVVQYFDGSLRGRQTVTKDNTTNTTIVGETYYDYQGRPAIQVMPAPTLKTVIGYTAGFNVGFNSPEYSQSNYDTLVGTSAVCDVHADSMNNTTGASQYYSPNNPQANIGLNQFIPDAQYYPFTETEYTPDNTGRINRQGGVGKYHQLGTGHETKYYYGTPDQNELDALFGTEVGDKSHYFKNMVRDANGQYSVSYVDMHGRTIATALAGYTPSTMAALPSNNTKTITETLADSGSVSIRDQSMVSQKSLLVAKADTYNFHYSLLPDSLHELNCNQQSICYTCRYDLDITITDNCGNQTWGGQPYAISRHNFSLATLANSCVDTAINFNFSVPLPEGSFLVTKKLTINKDAYNFYRDSIYLPNNTCTSISQFITQQKAVVAKATTQCTPDCASCMANIGDSVTFLANYNKSVGLPAGDPTYQAEANAARKNALDACSALCQTTTAGNDILSAMIQDVTPPYGQYADTLLAVDADKYSIFYVKRADTAYVPVFQLPGVQYHDDNGKLDSVYNAESGLMVIPNSLSRAQFVQNFRSSWAIDLLQYHPEYCRLQVLQSNNSSLLWDRQFEATDTYAAAVAAGYNNPLTGTNQDPLTVSYPNILNSLNDKFTNYKTIQGPNTPLSMWGLAIAMVKSDSGNAASVSQFSTTLANLNTILANMCPGDQDMSWRNFRELYQGQKQLIFNQQLLANPANCQPLNTRIYTSEPKVSDLSSAGHQSEFMDVTSTVAQTTDLKTYLDAESGPNAASKKAADVKDSLNLFYDNNCAAFAKQWFQQLSACTLYTDTADLDNVLVNGLKTLCRQACDAGHPYGASSLPAGQTISINGFNVNNFQDIVNHYNQSKGINDPVHCNAELITSPLPYDNQPVYSAKPVYSRPSDCECGLINGLYNVFTLAHKAGETFATFLQRTQQITVSEADLDQLRSMCGNTTNSASCRNVSQPIYLPPAMQCHTGQTCSSCHVVDSLYLAFRAQYPAIQPSDSSDMDTAQAQKNIVFQNFMNNRLGYNLQSWQYLQFMDTCKAHPADTAMTTNCLPTTIAQMFSPSGTGVTDVMSDIRSTPDGGYILAGKRQLASSSYPSAYLLRYNSAGVIQWARSYTGTAYSDFVKVRVASDNGYTAVGTACYSSNVSNGKVFVVHTDASGNLLWQKSIGLGSLVGEIAFDIIQTKDHGYAIVGDHDITTPGHSGTATILVMKLDASGNIVWANALGQNHGNDGYTIAESPLGDTLYVAGRQWIEPNGVSTVQGVLMKVQGSTGVLYNSLSIQDASLGLAIGDITATGSGLKIWNFGSVDGGGTYGRVGIMTMALDGTITNSTRIDLPPGNLPAEQPNTLTAIPTMDGGWLVGETGLHTQHIYWAKLNQFGNAVATRMSKLPGTQTIGGIIQNPDSSFTILGTDSSVAMLLNLSSNAAAGCYDSLMTLNLSNPVLSVATALQSTSPLTQNFNLFGTLPDSSIGITSSLVTCPGSTNCYSVYNGPLLCGKSSPLLGPAIDSVTNCSDSTFFAVSTGTSLFKNYSDSLTGDFEQRYLSKCMQAYRHETFTVTHNESEYHYTLYYYDQAGNLLKTVSPAGVQQNTDSVWLSQVRAARAAGQSLVPTHTMVTNYRYNTLSQVVAQHSPDGGTSYFWYDRLGRLAVSQNGRQRLSNQYSYTQYDSIGRITQVGQLMSSTAITDGISRNEVPLLTWENNALPTADQITVTAYDTASYTIAPAIGQRNVRNRVSWTGLFNKATDLANGMLGVAAATYYSYDILGNVDTLMQDFGDTVAVKNSMNTTNNRFKKIVYDFDLVSGKVNKVTYQHGRVDAFYHTYFYDAENRITNVQSSTDSVNWDNDAFYSYYAHGPLARTILGQQQVQGINYAYTLQGWLKSINPAPYTGGNFTLRPDSAGNVVANSAYNLLLDYFDGDYKPISPALGPDNGVSAALGGTSGTYRPLYNGNISSMGVNINKLNAPLLYNYQYDQLNRLVHMDAWKRTSTAWNALSPTTNYQENITYDPNGNILTYKRNADSSTGSNEMDKLKYWYPTGTNQLDHITDTVTAVAHNDISNQSAGNYKYDSIGELISDSASRITNIAWTVYGKIDSITKAGDTTIHFTYDPSGNRISKAIRHAGNTETTWYVRDAQGNVLSVYTSGDPMVNAGNLAQTELHLYGSSRLGIWKRSVDVKDSASTSINPYPLPGDSIIFTRGNKLFELSNHLDNVLVTISDKRYGVSTDNSTVNYFNPEVVSANDYYPFGMLQSARSYSEANVGNYRYGFNGKENDNEVKGVGDQIDYGMRIYDPRIGRFLSVDPLTHKYPWYTPFQFAGNTPIQAIDLDGKEEYHYTLVNIKKNGSSVSVLTLTSIKQLPATNLFGQKYPGGQIQRATIEYNGETYHVGYTGDDPDAMNIFNIWKNHPNAEIFESLFPSDDMRKKSSPELKRLFSAARDYFVAMLTAVPAGFTDFEPVELKNGRKGGKEINKEVKKISNGGGTPRLEEDGTQKIYRNDNGKYPEYQGAKEYKVTVEGREDELRILQKEVGTDDAGKPLYKYGWTDSHYKVIYDFKVKEVKK